MKKLSDDSERIEQHVDDANKLEQQAREHFEKGELSEASDLLERAVILKPEDPDLYYALAITYERMGMHSSAKQAYGSVVQLDATRADAWRRLSHVAQLLGKRDTALAASFHAVGVEPNSADSWLTHGSVLSENEMWKDAEEALKKAVELTPESAWTWLNLGIMLDRSGRSGEAIGPVKKALEISPDHPSILEVSARIFSNDHRFHDAEQAIRRAIDMGLTDGYAHMTLAQILSRMDRDEESIETLRSVVEMSPEVSEFHFALGDMLLSQGSIDEAEESLTHAYRLDSHHIGAQELLDQIKMRRAGGGSEMTVFVHDRAEQLSALVAQAGMIQNALLREFREIERVEVTLDREVGATDQTHYVVTGITLSACGIGLDDLNGRLEEWMEVNNVNECGNVRLQVTKSQIMMNISTLKGGEEVSG